MKQILTFLLLFLATNIYAQNKTSYPLNIVEFRFEIDTPGIVYKPLHWRFSAANNGFDHGWRVCWRMEIDTAAKIFYTMTDSSGMPIDTLPLEPHTSATSYFTLKTERRPLSTNKNFYGVIRTYFIRKEVKDSSDYVSGLVDALY